MKCRKEMMAKVITAFLSVMLITPSAVNVATYNDFIDIKETTHEIAEKARSIGLPETHDIIVNAQKLWHEADQAINNEEYDKPEMITYYSENDVRLLAQVCFCEARGIKSKTEVACIMWTILNRHDFGYGSIKDIVTAPNQFSYYSSAPTISDYGYDLVGLASDVLERWNNEKNGVYDVGRVLPKDYLWYSGDGKHNKFRNQYKTSSYWDYSLKNPYDN